MICEEGDEDEEKIWLGKKNIIDKSLSEENRSGCTWPVKLLFIKELQ